MPILNPYKDFTINTKWDNSINDVVPESLVALKQSSTLNNFVLAFIVAENSGACKPAWGGYPEYSVEKKWGKQGIDSFKQIGGVATISFGGASGIPLESACRDVSSLNNAISAVINAYALKILDFDIEGANLNNQVGIENLAKAIKQIQQKDSQVKISLTLPVLPSGLTQEGLNVVNIFKNNGVNFKVNIMAMDYGKWTAPDLHAMGQYAISAINATQQQLKTIYNKLTDDYIWQNMLAITPMLGVNDVWHYPENQPECFTVDDARTLANYAKQRGFEIRYWSIERDNPCDQSYVSTVCSGGVQGKKAQEKPFDYTKALKGGSALGILLAQQAINITTSLNEAYNNTTNGQLESEDESNNLLKVQVMTGVAVSIALLTGTALAVKKYGHHVTNALKSVSSFWRNSNENEAFGETESLSKHKPPTYS